MSEKKKTNWKLILNILAFVGLLVLVYAIRHQITQSYKSLSHIKWWLLLFIPIWQVLNYDAYSRQNRDLFAILGKKVEYKFLYRLNLELNFVNHILPSGGVSGFSYFSLRMKEKNVSGAQASLVQLLRFVLVYVAFLFLLIIALFMLSFSGHVNRFVLLAGGSISTLIVVGTIGIAFVIGSQRRINGFFGFITKALNRLIHLVRPKHPETINIARARKAVDDLHDNYTIIQDNWTALRWPLIWSLAANVTELLTLYTVYLAFGHAVNPGAIILAYAIANFAGFVSVLPSGIGVYEALMTGVLAIGGVSAAISIPVTVMYRVVSMTVQVLPGYYLYSHRTRSAES